MSINIPLLRKTVEWVEEQERLTKGRVWDQEDWFNRIEDDEIELMNGKWCQTTMCVAGKIVMDAGWLPIDPAMTSIVSKDGIEEFPDVIAGELLGLNPEHARMLFGADNDAKDIRRLAELFAGERL